MRQKIRLDTMTEIRDFVAAATKVNVPVYLTDGTDLIVSAKSLLGVMYTMEWSDVYCTCDVDIYSLIEKFAI